MFKALQFYLSTRDMHRKQYFSDHHNTCHMTSWICILQFLLNNWSWLIACNLRANIHREYRFEDACTQKLLNCCRKSKWKNVHKRNRSIGMLSAGCRQQDVARQFNVHPSTISRRLSRWVTWHFSTRQCHLKTTVRHHRFIVTTSRRNLFISGPKDANELHRVSGLRINDQSGRNRFLRNFNLRVQKQLVAVHSTQHHHQTHVAWATIRMNELSSNGMYFCFHLDFADGHARV
jgi:hypothetical protein